MNNQNIRYNSLELESYYNSNRQHWSELYKSEQCIFEKVVSNNRLGTVLDVGCACGGLGTALCERFTIDSYTGIDISETAIEWAMGNRAIPVPSKFLAGDILEVEELGMFDTVVSLSCADWNIETGRIIGKCWEHVKTGGHMIISLRLTTGEGVNDITKSYQHINFSRKVENPEIANYVIFNVRDALREFVDLAPSPEVVGGYGYWGAPSSTAVAPYDSLLFAVFFLKKGADTAPESIRAEFNLPVNAFL